MPSWLAAFAENQPITVTTNALRGLILGGDVLPAGDTVAGPCSWRSAWAIGHPGDLRSTGGAYVSPGGWLIAGVRSPAMCRNITKLRDYDTPATREEVEAAALQFVRKVSGYRQPSRANQAVFDTAVEQIADATTDLLGSLVVKPPVR